MRVAHFVQRYPPALGGAEAYFARLSRFLAAAGNHVSVFTTTAHDLEAFWSSRGRSFPANCSVDEGIRVHRYPLWRFPGRRYLLKALSLFPHRLWQCLTLPCNPISWRMWSEAGRPRERFDVVHATAFPYAFPIACGLRLARRLRIPFFLTPFLHLGDPANPTDPTRRAYLQPALLSLIRAADRVFVQTRLEREALLREGIPGAKLLLQGMAVAAEECTGGDRIYARKDCGISEDEVVIGHLANLSEEKGSVDLLLAAELVWSQKHHFRLVLAGPEMPNFQRFWQSYVPKNQVVRLGVLSDRQKKDFFAGLDVFALPSRSDSFGLVLLEAWANGLPTLGYRAGGIAEVIQHERDGLLVACGDVDDLARALIRLVQDPALREQLGHAGQQRTAQEFRWEDKLELVRNEYEKAVGSGHWAVGS